MPPVVPVAIAAAASIGAGIAAATGATLAALALTIVSIGASLIGQFLVKPDAPKQQSNLRLQEESEHPAFRYRFGEFRTQGQVVFRVVTGGNLWMTILLNATSSDSISRIWINDDHELDISDKLAALVDMDGPGARGFAGYIGRDGGPLLVLYAGLGDQTKYPQDWLDHAPLMDAAPELANASWNGCTVLHVSAYYGDEMTVNDRWWLGQPRFEVLGKWAKLYDPRLDPTLGLGSPAGVHDPDDPDTWEWSANPALVALFCLREPKILGRRDEQLLIDMIAEAADDCDASFEEIAGRSIFDATFPTSGAPDAPPSATDIATKTMTAVAGSGGDPASITFSGTLPAEPSPQVQTGVQYDFVGASQTWRLLVTAKSYNGDNDITTLKVTPGSTAFSAQSITIRTTTESASATIPEATFALISGDADYSTTQYSGTSATGFVFTAGVTPVIRLKSLYPNLTVVGLHMDLLSRGVDVDAGVKIKPTVVGFGVGGNSWRGFKYYQADKASNGVGDPTAKSFGLPSDATNIVLVHDAGLNQAGSPAPNPVPSDGLTVTSRYFSILMEGGPNSGTAYFEIGKLEFVITQNAATRYRCDGVVEVNQRDFGLLDDVLASMAGYIDTSAGKIAVRAGVWKAPVKTLPVPVGESFEVVDRSDPGFDEIVGVYLAREKDYTQHETDPYIIGIANGRRQELPLAMVREAGQAARLTAIAAERGRKNRSFTAVYSGREWDLRVGDRVTTSLDFWPDADGNWMITAERPLISEVEDGFLVRKELTLVEDDEATYTFDSDSFTGSPVTEPRDPVPLAQPTPRDLTALSDETTAREVVDGGTGSTLLVPRIFAHWLQATVEPDRYEVQIDDGTGYRFWGYVDSEQTTTVSSETRVYAYIEPVTVGVAYDIRVRSIGASVSTWIEVLDVLVQALPTDLGVPVFVSEAYDEPTETRTLTIRMPDSADARQLKVYVSDTEFGARSLLYSAFVGANVSVVVTDTQAFTGFTRWYHATAFDLYGSSGAEVTQSYTATSTKARAFSTAFDTAFD